MQLAMCVVCCRPVLLYGCQQLSYVHASYQTLGFKTLSQLCAEARRARLRAFSFLVQVSVNSSCCFPKLPVALQVGLNCSVAQAVTDGCCCYRPL
jgi:hypothetical protein